MLGAWRMRTTNPLPGEHRVPVSGCEYRVKRFEDHQLAPTRELAGRRANAFPACSFFEPSVSILSSRLLACRTPCARPLALVDAGKRQQVYGLRLSAPTSPVRPQGYS